MIQRVCANANLPEQKPSSVCRVYPDVQFFTVHHLLANVWSEALLKEHDNHSHNDQKELFLLKLWFEIVELEL